MCTLVCHQLVALHCGGSATLSEWPRTTRDTGGRTGPGTRQCSREPPPIRGRVANRIPRLWPTLSPSTSIWMDAAASSTSVAAQAPSPSCSHVSSRSSSGSTRISACWLRPSALPRKKKSPTPTGSGCEPKISPDPSAPSKSSASPNRSTGWTDLAWPTQSATFDANGAVVQVHLSHGSPPSQVSPSGPYPSIPEVTIDELHRYWLGPDRRAGQGFRNTSPDGEDAVFQAAGFAPEQLVVGPDDRILERSADDVVAWVLLTSSTAPHLFGDHLDDFIRDLRRLLLDASPGGRFSVALSDNRLRICRPT